MKVKVNSYDNGDISHNYFLLYPSLINFRETYFHCNMAGPRTRHKSESSMAAYLGAALNMLPSELPTLRAILRQGL